ncbi:MAG: InlB B-repeat-containing protein, partial [Bacteroidales bacterium]|nr:InlB B-repeat-containing protein [Bacteroidales bacterium]
DVKYTAKFRSLVHNLTLNIIPGREAGNTNGGGSFKEGTPVTVEATAKEGYRFVAWMNGDAELSKDNPYTFTMPNENTTYEAVFEPLYTLSLHATPENAGTVTGNGQYAKGESVTIAATANENYVFVAWMDGDETVSTETDYTFDMPAEPVTYTATFRPTIHNVTVLIKPNREEGTVSGEGKYKENAAVTLTATPKNGYRFKAWMNGDAELSKANPYTFTMPAHDVTYAAVFEPLYTLTLNETPLNAGTVTGENSYAAGDEVTITATPDEDYAFVAWMDGEDVVSTEASHTFTMPAKDLSYTATFRSLVHDVTLYIVPGREAGMTTGGGSYKEGATVTVKAEAYDGFRFTAWTDGDEIVSTQNPYSFTMPDADVRYTALFQAIGTEPEMFSLSLTVTPQNSGTVTGGGQYAIGEEVAITATANENFTFVAWMDGDETVSTEANHSFLMPAKNMAYTAVFEAVKPIEPETFDVVLNVTPQNTGTVTGNGRYAAGASVVIKATANEGYQFVAWKDGNQTVSTEASHSFTMPARNMTYTAVFEAVKPIVEPETFDVVLNVTPQNAGTVTGSGRYAAGASVVIKATANEGYRFVAWMNGNDTVSTETTHTFAMPASNVAYSALFVPYTNNEHLLSTAFDMVAKDGKLHIRNLNGIAVKTVDVYGLSGVRFNRFTLNSRENLVLPVDAERAILIVRITTEQGITVHKVYLH